MKKLNSLIIGSLLLFGYTGNAQNIGGILNSYAAVTGISGTGISVSSATAAVAFMPGDRIMLIQMKGALIDQSNTVTFGNIITTGGAGTYEFLTVLAVAGNLINTTSALTNTYNTNSGAVQLVRVPKFCNPTVTSPVTCTPWNIATKTGGIIAFEAGTLTLNSDIDASAKGFTGGNFTTGSFGCDDGNFAAAAGTHGGQKGESISLYLGGLNGLKGKQANGGGGSNIGNSGGGGGGNGGAGGLGGNQYSGCDSTFDDRGIGGLNLNAAFSTLFMGGGGGGGFSDNGLVATQGGNGGGIIYIKANAIISNNKTISASGGSVTIFSDAEGAGGGGAGGTIFLACNNISGNLAVKTDGGSGGSNNNSVFVVFCHGPGGGGGGGVFAMSPPALPPGTTYSSLGGMAGTINNTASACYGTTFGAHAGANGVSLTGLPTALQTLDAAPGLSITQSDTICKGQSASITASGGTYYSWNTGATNSVIVVSPTLTSAYTVIGTGTGSNACQASLSTTVTVASCTGINSLSANNDAFKIYPNPTNGKLFIETKAVARIIICDVSGKTILEQTFQKGDYNMDISNYIPGVYFIKIMDGHEIRAIKLIKAD